jgi:uncharacterized protein Yka (UPF0111/DUF47 family)
MIMLFSKTRELETQTDEFCDKVSQGVLAFNIGVKAYLEHDQEAFEEKRRHVSELESRGDELRREIQRRLYLETLLPESRGDVRPIFRRPSPASSSSWWTPSPTRWRH